MGEHRNDRPRNRQPHQARLSVGLTWDRSTHSSTGRTSTTSRSRKCRDLRIISTRQPTTGATPPFPATTDASSRRTTLRRSGPGTTLWRRPPTRQNWSSPSSPPVASSPSGKNTLPPCRGASALWEDACSHVNISSYGACGEVKNCSEACAEKAIRETRQWV